jgi:hypothetical protein
MLHADGFEAEGLITRPAPGGDLPVAHRTADTGDGVIDLAAMRAELGG